MFAMLLAKFPPPTPAVAATRTMTQNGVCGFCTTTASPAQGTISSSAETIVQFRPPNLGTAKAYGNRRVAPTRFGTAMSQNSWCSDNEKPDLFSDVVTMVHSCQTEKPRNSAKIDSQRLRWAVRRPVASHWATSSGSWSSTQRPDRGGGT